MLLKDKIGLICNVANHRSAAWAIAKAADAAGAKLAIGYLGDRERVELEKVVGELSQTPLIVRCDAGSDESLAALGEKLHEEFGRVDFLCHAIAYAKGEDLSGRFVDTSREGFKLAHDISAYSLAAMARMVMPLMPEGGSISSLSYIGAVRAMPNYNVMGVAKASLEATTRYLAADLGPQNIRVNAISAGPMRTLAAAGIADFKKMHRAVAAVAPLRRNTTQEEVADVAVFLASDMSRGMTGDVLYVDNGFHIAAGLPEDE